MKEYIISVVAFAAVFVSIFAYCAWNRYLVHVETMAKLSVETTQEGGSK